MRFAIATVVNIKLYINELKYLVVKDIWLRSVRIVGMNKINWEDGRV